MDLDGINADPCRVMYPDKSNQVGRIAAAGIEDHRSRHDVLRSEIV
jgi:hypothetical protein